MRGAVLGREAEIEALERAVSEHRVVTVTGPPGVGKSALAALVAESRTRSIVAALSAAESEEAVCRALAGALALPLPPVASVATSIERVGRALAQRGRAVVVLDDADLARAVVARLITRWAREAAAVRFVVTSRARLPLGVASRFDVGPLAVPAAGERDADVIVRSAAVRLFVRAAQAAAPTYVLRRSAAHVVADIVRRLEGLPLAIELCASRVVVLGEREILELLTRSLEVLDEGAGALRGRSLRGAFTLSWEQLEEDDARVLAACASFRGSFDLDAAAAVSTTKGAAAPRLALAGAMERLEEASLVRAFEPETLPGARRYALSATLRGFVAAKLRERPEADEVARRHALHFASLAGAKPRRSLDALALCRDDLDRALAWSLGAASSAGKPKAARELAAQLLLAIAPLVLARGPLAPFLVHVDELLAGRPLPGALASELHLTRALARIFHGRRDDALLDLTAAKRLAKAATDVRTAVLATSKTGLVVGLKGDFRAAHRHLTAARELLGRASEPWLRGIVHKDLANVLSEEGRNDDAMVELARARDLFHAAGDTREEGFVLMMLGSRLVDEGRLADARRDCTGALALLRSAGDRRSEGWTSTMLALVDAEEGDLASARTRLEAALASFRAIGDTHTEGLVLGYLGNVALEQGAMSDAESAYRDARALLAEASDHGSEAMCVAGAAIVELACGRAAPARDAFAKAKRLLAKDGRAARREAVAILESAMEGSGTKPRRPAARPVRVASAEEIRFARRVVAKLKAPAASTDAGVVLARDGSWVRTAAGDVVRVARGGAVRRILERLAVERVRYPGRSVTLGALVRAGWPDETILPGAAKNRLHVTIARLRRGGLHDLLVHEEDGYLLDPRVPVRLAEEGERAPDERRGV